jgi:hypothetical protein
MMVHFRACETRFGRNNSKRENECSDSRKNRKNGREAGLKNDENES